MHSLTSSSLPEEYTMILLQNIIEFQIKNIICHFPNLKNTIYLPGNLFVFPHINYHLEQTFLEMYHNLSYFKVILYIYLKKKTKQKPFPRSMK